MAIASSQEDNGSGKRRSNGNEGGGNGAATLRSKADEYKQISDLTGFDNLRAMLEAEALIKKRKKEKKRLQNFTNVASFYFQEEHAAKEKGKPGKDDAVHIVEKSNAESVQISGIVVPQNLFIDSAKEEEDVGTVQAVETTKVIGDDDVETTKQISDLTGFHNLRAMMEAEALIKKRKEKKKRLQNYTNVDTFYFQEGHAAKEKGQLGKDEAVHVVEKSNAESVQISEINLPQNFFEHAAKEKGQLAKDEAVHVVEKSNAESVQESEINVPQSLFIDSAKEEEDVGTVKAVETTKVIGDGDVDTTKQISELTGFDNLRAMMEAEALIKKRKKRRQNYPSVDSFYFQEEHAAKEKGQLGKDEAIHVVEKSNAESVQISEINLAQNLFIDSAKKEEDIGTIKAVETTKVIGDGDVETTKQVSDLTGFDNIRSIMEAKALIKKRKKEKKRLQNYTNVDCFYFQEEHDAKEKGQLSKDEVVHIVAKPNAESVQISGIVVPQNLFEHAAKEKGQLGKDEAVHVVEKSNAESVQISEIDVPQNLFIDSAKKEENVGTVKAVETTKAIADGDVKNSVEVINSCLSSPRDDATFTSMIVRKCVGDTAANGMRKKRKNRQTTKLMTEKDAVDNHAKEESGIKDNVVLRTLLKKPRYFDPPSCDWGSRSNSAPNCKVQKQDKPCFRCGSFEHIWRFCKQDSDCFVCHGRNDLGNNLISNVCLRCGDPGHDMFSCRANYPADDLKKIQCYVCKKFGHLCCVNFPDMGRKRVSCHNCGQYGHMGCECIKWHGVPHDTTSSLLCSNRGKEGYYAQKLSTHLVWRRSDYLTSNAERTQTIPEK